MKYYKDTSKKTESKMKWNYIKPEMFQEIYFIKYLCEFIQENLLFEATDICSHLTIEAET